MMMFDMHTHASKDKPNPCDMILKMEKSGIYGGCVFSTRPLEYDKKVGLSFEDRLNELSLWTKGYEDRIFPVLWIHPYEENILEKIKIAVSKGVCAFKIICTDFYVYEEQCLKVLTEIAKYNKPVFFHSGILWDGKVSSKYNRPVNWESLLKIKGLRFSMGHCSWPWIDECIALYGKFLNSLLKGETAEMFFDITPGTPDIYREELLTKLYTIGYDIGDNIMFGTDANSSDYNSEWTKKWLETDREIMDKLGVSKQNREKMYHDNLMRFLGKNDVKVNHISPETDNSHGWSPVNYEVYKIIEKWYNTLDFPKEFDAEFKKALNDIKISDAITIENFDETNDGKRNLLSFLFMCENLKNEYEKKKIPEEILLDTLSDIVIWNNTWSDIKDELYLGECKWLKNHLSMKLFKLGRLQFKMAETNEDIPDFNINKGDNVVEIHIPKTGPLDILECKKSVEYAKEFFKEFFPEFNYKHFTCSSWLLDKTLGEMLSPKTNIIKFQNMFCEVKSVEADSILKFLFRWNINRRKLIREVPVSSFAKSVKERALAGGKFYSTLGILK